MKTNIGYRLIFILLSTIVINQLDLHAQSDSNSFKTIIYTKNEDTSFIELKSLNRNPLRKDSCWNEILFRSVNQMNLYKMESSENRQIQFFIIAYPDRSGDFRQKKSMVLNTAFLDSITWWNYTGKVNKWRLQWLIPDSIKKNKQDLFSEINTITSKSESKVAILFIFILILMVITSAVWLLNRKLILEKNYRNLNKILKILKEPAIIEYLKLNGISEKDDFERFEKLTNKLINDASRDVDYQNNLELLRRELDAGNLSQISLKDEINKLKRSLVEQENKFIYEKEKILQDSFSQKQIAEKEYNVKIERLENSNKILNDNLESIRKTSTEMISSIQQECLTKIENTVIESNRKINAVETELNNAKNELSLFVTAIRDADYLLCQSVLGYQEWNSDKSINNTIRYLLGLRALLNISYCHFTGTGKDNQLSNLKNFISENDDILQTLHNLRGFQLPVNIKDDRQLYEKTIMNHIYSLFNKSINLFPRKFYYGLLENETLN